LHWSRWTAARNRTPSASRADRGVKITVLPPATPRRKKMLKQHHPDGLFIIAMAPATQAAAGYAINQDQGCLDKNPDLRYLPRPDSGRDLRRPYN